MYQYIFITVQFDQLGLTDNQNPFGAFPPLFARSLGGTMGSMLTDYLADYMGNRRSIRSTRSVPTLPKPIHSYFNGGERALLYTIIEDMLANFGMDGKACLLRAICEVHSHTALDKFGFLGEFLELFLTASRSKYADLMDEYVTAETTGKHKECFPYFKECPKSLFLNNHNYSNNAPKDESMVPMNDSNVKDNNNEIDSHDQSRLSADGNEFKPMAM
ncbi:Hypothetical protein CINCED_3A008282 [Cinara cedri]|uniref:Uncharacterized protein n=1 Tax=Cinara cedri TaxID=506608 RepID=A0A5E4NJ24_9HEMI|nr:Hypothetical protein CINCED_3A008282 [Cinara cedri]